MQKSHKGRKTYGKALKSKKIITAIRAENGLAKKRECKGGGGHLAWETGYGTEKKGRFHCRKGTEQARFGLNKLVYEERFRERGERKGSGEKEIQKRRLKPHCPGTQKKKENANAGRKKRRAPSSHNPRTTGASLTTQTYDLGNDIELSAQSKCKIKSKGGAGCKGRLREKVHDSKLRGKERTGPNDDRGGWRRNS